MSKQHNYSQYSNKKKPNHEAKKPAPEAKAVEAFVTGMTATPIEEKVEPITKAVKAHNDPVETPRQKEKTPDRIAGIVVDCTKLNVRSEPSIAGDVVCVLDAHSELEVDLNKSNNDWYKICTAIGAEGYCMRKYINTNL